MYLAEKTGILFCFRKMPVEAPKAKQLIEPKNKI